MRLIWTTENIDHYRAFTAFLEKKHIRFLCEEKVERDWAKEQYGNKEFVLWIYEEDDALKTQEYLKTFLENPQHPDFEQKEEPLSHKTSASLTNYVEHKLHHDLEAEQKQKKTRTTRFTSIVLLVCALIFLLYLQTNKAYDEAPLGAKKMLMTSSSVKRDLLYDYPESYELLDKIVALYGYEALVKPETLEAPGKFLYNEYEKIPIWRGFYPYIVAYVQSFFTADAVKWPPPFEKMPIFEKERQGELWRMITPIFLHNDILHIFFNMIWLLLLGTQIELRIGPWRSLTFMLLVALVTNTAQYLISGPHFLGYSGIIIAHVFFIRQRQHAAPWEGYHMTRSTFAFICFFVGILFSFSFIGFVLEAFFASPFTVPIANTAHVVGALMGYFLGKWSFFTERYID